MIKKLFFFAALLFPVLATQAQDILFWRNGNKDTVKVEEITDKQISYKKFKRPEGPIYRVPRSEIVLILYADGTSEVMDTEPPVKDPVVVPAENNNNTTATATPAAKPPMVPGKNIVSINVFNVVNGNLHLGYERILNPNIGLKLSVNTQLTRTDADILAYERKFTTGLDLNFYPAGQGKIRYFLGPAFRVGRVQDTWSIGNNIYPEYSYASFYFNNGFYIHPTPNFYLGFQAAFGFAHFNMTTKIPDNTPNIYYHDRKYTELDGMIAYNIGYRF